MLLNLNRTNSRTGCCSRQRVFLTLLVLNTFLGGIYFIHEQQDQQIDQKSTNTRIWHDIFNHQQPNQDFSQTNKAMKFIEDTLEIEYNQDDLNKFYNQVQMEYSLGLKCKRKNSSNIVKQIVNNNGKPTAAVSSLLPSFNSTTKLSQSDHFQRTDLYKFLIDNSDACLNKPVDLLIIVISKSDSYKTRDAIRRTWGARKSLNMDPSINVKFFFLIDFDEKLSQNVRLENNIFHDIIQVELPQHYTLVTHRVLSLFEWSFRYCRSAKYLFKTDDDVFINTILLLKFIAPLIRKPINTSFVTSDMKIYGYPHRDAFVFRLADSPVLARYMITFDEYSCERYPTFLSGFGYVIPKKARDAILYAAYQDPDPFRISDVYLTGIVADYLSISRELYSNYTIEYNRECEVFFNMSRAFACASGSHHGGSNDPFDKFNTYWRLIKKTFRNSQ